MRIRLEDAIAFPAKDVVFINDQLIRFKLAISRQSSAYQKFLLGEYSSPNQIFPSAPNREGVEYNLASITKELDVGFAGMRDKPLGASGILRSRRDFLLFNIDHFCHPTYVYTNGQAIVSVVRRDDRRFEIVHHRSLSDFNGFDSEYDQPDFISADKVTIAASFRDAEWDARQKLSTVKTREFRMRKGGELDHLILQSTGSRTDKSGYPIEVYIGRFRGQEFRVEMGGGEEHEPYRTLNELHRDGFVVEACATCKYFQFSGMSRDMSSGSRGYCRHSSHGGETNTLGVVSVTYYCKWYTFCSDDKRPIPFM